MAETPSTAHIVAWATLAGALTQAIGPAFRYLAGRRLAQRKATLQELAQKQSDLDTAYVRLERENVRLTRELDETRAELKATEEELERIRERCAECERWMRQIGRRSDFPDPPGTPPTEPSA